VRARERIPRVRSHIIIIIIMYTTERDVSGAAVRVTATAVGRSGFRAFFSPILRERGNYNTRHTDVLFLRLIFFRRRALDFHSDSVRYVNRVCERRTGPHTLLREVGEV